jgi:hypothetical protein
MSNKRARSLRRMREREAVAALMELAELAHHAVHVLIRVADAPVPADIAAECLYTAQRLVTAISAVQ